MAEEFARARALHATEKGSKLGKSVAAYAKEVGRPGRTVVTEVAAAEVYEEVGTRVPISVDAEYRALAEIHAAPRWLWPALVAKLEAESLTVARLREVVAEMKGTPEPLPAFATAPVARYSAQTRNAMPAASGEELERMMPGSEHSGESQSLKRQIEDLRNQLGAVEVRATAAEQEAHWAREEVLRLRDQVVAAERDQQDLKTARARLARTKRRGLWARILNR